MRKLSGTILAAAMAATAAMAESKVVKDIAYADRTECRLDATESTSSPESEGALSFPCDISVNSVLFMEITQNKGDKR